MKVEVQIDTHQADLFYFHKMEGEEELSSAYWYDISLVSTKEIPISDFDNYVGKELTLKCLLNNGKTRFFTGFITHFSMTGYDNIKTPFYKYRVTIRPWLWLLNYSMDCQVHPLKVGAKKTHERQDCLEIVQRLITKRGLPFSFERGELGAGDLTKLDYSVQFEETDFDYINRMLEDDGIYYFFKHTGQGRPGHHMWIGNSPALHESFEGYEKVIFSLQPDAHEERISEMALEQQFRPGKYESTYSDYKRAGTQNKAQRKLQTQNAFADNLTIYDADFHRGKLADQDGFMRLRAEQIETGRKNLRGKANVEGLCVGRCFSLSQGGNDSDYFVTYTKIKMEVPLPEFARVPAHKDIYSFDCEFRCVPKSEHYRAVLKTKRPRIHGVLMGTVVNTQGTDHSHFDRKLDSRDSEKFVRVFVKLDWDRDHDLDEEPSIPVRVATLMAGGNGGLSFVPKTGEEVLVSFANGDPDDPVITGSLFNSRNRPGANHLANPDQVRLTVPVGGATSRDQANEFVMDSAPGKELIHIHAEKDYKLTTENDSTEIIHNNLTVEVEVGNETHTVTAGKRTTTIKGDESLTVQSGNRELKVETGTNKETIQGYETRTLKTGRKDVVESGGEIREITGGQKLTIKGGVIETVNGGVTETIETGDHLHKVAAGAFNSSASMGYKFETPLNYEIKAGAQINLYSPKVMWIVNEEIKVANKESWLKAFSTKGYGIKYDAVGLDTKTVGTSIAVNGIKAEATGVSASTTGMKVDINGLVVKNTLGYTGTNGAFKIECTGGLTFLRAAIHLVA